MKKSDFLFRLKKEGKLEIVEQSDNLKAAYSIKSDYCMKAAKILLKEGVYENAVSEAYYGMYNCTISLLFQCGIKCENHTAAFLLLRELFALEELSKILEKAKKERIDKQYYVPEDNIVSIGAGECKLMIQQAEEFCNGIRVYQSMLSNLEIDKIRKKFAI